MQGPAVAISCLLAAVCHVLLVKAWVSAALPTSNSKLWRTLWMLPAVCGLVTAPYFLRGHGVSVALAVSMQCPGLRFASLWMVFRIVVNDNCNIAQLASCTNYLPD